MSGLIELLEGLLEDEPDLSVVLTASRGVTLPANLPDRVEHRARPADLKQKAERFLNDVDPHVVVLTGDDLVLSAIPACKAREIPLLLVDAHLTSKVGALSFLTDMRTRNRLRQFDRVLAASEADAAQFRNAGGDDEAVEVLGPLEPGPKPPSCNPGERDELADLIGTRPVWSAVALRPDEVGAVERAHRQSSRISHRLLLIISPADPSDEEAIAEQLAGSNWAVGRRSQSVDPSPEIDILIADDPEELGLWVRLAPITFIGSSLYDPGVALDPYGPACLGSAVLHGPKMGAYAEQAERLNSAGASVIVQDGDQLGEAVMQLLSPERAARQAHRAWEVTSAGAESVARAREVVLHALDQAG
ncbi:MAG: glycosyltransferase N-terminal domain-containing protein [Pseudomonadota bacterium]